MSSPTEQVKALLNDVQQDGKRYQQLIELLQQQRQGMLACDAGKSEAIGVQLMQVYPELEASAQRRAQTLENFRLPVDSVGLRALFSRLPETLKAHAENGWKKLEQQALLCQQLNERNGTLLNSQRESLGQLLKIEGEERHLYGM